MLDFSPCRTTFKNLVTDFAVSTLQIIVDSLNTAGTCYLSFDKGDTNKNKNSGLIKLICWFAEDFTDDDHPEGQIMMVPLDADKCRGSSKEVAEAIKHTIKHKLVGLEGSVVVLGFCMDNGGGGTVESVALPLKENGVLDKMALVANCCLHNMNLCYCVPIKHFLLKQDDRGTDTRDVL